MNQPCRDRRSKHVGEGGVMLLYRKENKLVRVVRRGGEARGTEYGQLLNTVSRKQYCRASCFGVGYCKRNESLKEAAALGRGKRDLHAETRRVFEKRTSHSNQGDGQASKKPRHGRQLPGSDRGV